VPGTKKITEPSSESSAPWLTNDAAINTCATAPRPASQAVQRGREPHRPTSDELQERLCDPRDDQDQPRLGEGLRHVALGRDPGLDQNRWQADEGEQGEEIAHAIVPTPRVINTANFALKPSTSLTAF
jgi:hypothetical protein